MSRATVAAIIAALTLSLAGCPSGSGVKNPPPTVEIHK